MRYPLYAGGMVDTLNAFLNARIDEKQQYAEALLTAGPRDVSGLVSLSRQMSREVEAVREIVRWHEAECTCSWCTADGEELDEPDFAPACPTLSLLAAIWNDHPDYQQEWAL